MQKKQKAEETVRRTHTQEHEMRMNYLAEWQSLDRSFMELIRVIETWCASAAQEGRERERANHTSCHTHVLQEEKRGKRGGGHKEHAKYRSITKDG